MCPFFAYKNRNTSLRNNLKINAQRLPQRVSMVSALISFITVSGSLEVTGV